MHTHSVGSIPGEWLDFLFEHFSQWPNSGHADLLCAKTTHRRRAWPTWRFCSGADWPCASDIGARAAIVPQRAPMSTAMPLRRSRRYGSVMNGSSRKSTSDCGVPVLAKLLPSAGYRRCWNFRSLTGFTALASWRCVHCPHPTSPSAGSIAAELRHRRAGRTPTRYTASFSRSPSRT